MKKNPLSYGHSDPQVRQWKAEITPKKSAVVLENADHRRYITAAHTEV